MFHFDLNRNEYLKLEHFNLIICNSDVVTMMMPTFIFQRYQVTSPFWDGETLDPTMVSFNNFCDVPKVAIIEKRIYPNFGYILDMKVKKEMESFYILGYLLKLIIKIW
jgi:hypothetical protein